MKRFLAALMALAFLVPAATSAEPQCGPDPAFGFRTTAGYNAAIEILLDEHAASLQGGYVSVDVAAARGLPIDELAVVAGAGILGDPIVNPFGVQKAGWSGFSGIVGVGAGSIEYYAVRFGETVAGPVYGSGSTDTVALYRQYLGAGQSTLPGEPCPIPQS